MLLQADGNNTFTVVWRNARIVKRANLMVTTMAEWDDRRPDNDHATIYFQKETATAAV